MRSCCLQSFKFLDGCYGFRARNVDQPPSRSRASHPFAVRGLAGMVQLTINHPTIQPTSQTSNIQFAHIQLACTDRVTQLTTQHPQFRLKASMVKRKFCQVCWVHRPGTPRFCPQCERRVGPGCWPEKCWAGDDINLCRKCLQRDRDNGILVVFGIGVALPREVQLAITSFFP